MNRDCKNCIIEIYEVTNGYPFAICSSDQFSFFVHIILILDNTYIICPYCRIICIFFIC